MSAPAGSPFPLTRGLLRILQQGLLVFLWLPWWGKIGVVLVGVTLSLGPAG